MKRIIESREFINLEQKAHGYKWGIKSWSDWGLLFRFLIVICKLLAGGALKRETKREPSEWSMFFGKKMKEGLSPKEIGKMWREGTRI